MTGSIVPLHTALVAFFLGAVAGGAILFRAGIGAGPLALLVRALLGLVLLAELVIHPALGVALALLVGAATWRARRSPESRESEQTFREAWRLPASAVAAMLVALAAAVLRPPVPFFWDESVWLSKARVACEGGAVLMERALDPQSELVPRGYPIVAAVVEASFALGDPSLPSLVAGGTALVLCALALYVLLLARAARAPFELSASVLVLGLTPLFWVHLRSVQLDLPVGLLLAALALAIERAEAGDRLGLPAAVTAALLLGIKDEGLLAALCVALALGTRGASGRARRAAWSAFLALALSVVVFRWRLWMASSANDDHSLGSPVPRLAIAIVLDALRDASDLQTWGLVPAVGLAALLATLRRSVDPRARRLAAALVLYALGLLVALVVGPPQVRDFALEGTLLDRFGLELLPGVALLVPRMLGEARSAPASPGAPGRADDQRDGEGAALGSGGGSTSKSEQGAPSASG